jgi:hypothetical protein
MLQLLVIITIIWVSIVSGVYVGVHLCEMYCCGQPIPRVSSSKRFLNSLRSCYVGEYFVMVDYHIVRFMLNGELLGQTTIDETDVELILMGNMNEYLRRKRKNRNPYLCAGVIFVNAQHHPTLKCFYDTSPSFMRPPIFSHFALS